MLSRSHSLTPWDGPVSIACWVVFFLPLLSIPCLIKHLHILLDFGQNRMIKILRGRPHLYGMILRRTTLLLLMDRMHGGYNGANLLNCLLSFFLSYIYTLPVPSSHTPWIPGYRCTCSCFIIPCIIHLNQPAHANCI